jgi:Domain of unknown function (DUF4159)
MKRFRLIFGVLISFAILATGQGWWGGGEANIDENTHYKSPREVPSHSTGTPVWTNSAGFDKDVFTFARVIRSHNGRYGRGTWSTDTPDSDLNLSYRLQQMTSIKVNPNGRFIRLTDPELVDYPFIYMVEPGSLYLNEDEILALRKYLNNGGFLMLDDFWGEEEWSNVAEVMERVLPGRRFVELDLSHQLYQAPFKITAKGQVPNIGLGIRSEFDPEHRTWERPDAKVVHHRAIMDDRERIMVLATHNTDNGDGWEREGESDYFFHNFSEKISYPLGINIIFYTMTH